VIVLSPLSARRLHVIDAIRTGDYTLQRSGDEAANQIRVGAYVNRRDLAPPPMSFADIGARLASVWLQSCNQDDQVYDNREDWVALQKDL